MVGGCFYLGVPSLTENVPGPARRDRFRLIDAHMKCLWPSECGTYSKRKERTEKREVFKKKREERWFSLFLFGWGSGEPG